ncbi:MAG: CbiX/SirB N-terminal domain-containing protein [Candidatus Caldarchaeales archaeon]
MGVSSDKLKVGVVLVGHGQLPRDLPSEIGREYMKLKFKVERSPEEEASFKSLEEKVMNWPRNESNDPYYHSLQMIAEELEKKRRYSMVWIAFIDFCKPTVKEAIEEACSSDVEVIVVTTTMMTRGGEHSEEDIPRILEEFKSRCGKPIIYAWPFNLSEIASLLSDVIDRYLLEFSMRMRI